MRRILVLTALLVLPAGAAAEPADDAETAVRAQLGRLAGIVAACRLPLAADAVALRSLVARELRPEADVLHGAQVVLGRHWQDASPVQRRRFAEALFGTLVARYASGLLLLTADNVRVLPGSETQRDGTVAVQLEVDAGLARPLPVFLHLRARGGRWVVHDARWEGQSFLLSLRRVYAEQIARRGLERVIESLEATAPGKLPPPERRATAAGRCLLALESV
ncbi:ABC transporter substrate-binding protein [Thioalkalivibrio sp. XN8]|uniref:MlaC/ttg2D family ABC transporter substrate-binding protein n=1 Tax=Thioalkalivibrio sp. XN8 TaxID=2712863 RepID=UPI0013EC71AE|nr:ABC transporter substrate-binding protein [Thioalkalivibrio sp. XN8]NGP54657.1 ABC transporter substrate-binding protein [Thioalkalivibrio sp. XN8]